MWGPVNKKQCNKNKGDWHKRVKNLKCLNFKGIGPRGVETLKMGARSLKHSIKKIKVYETIIIKHNDGLK